MKLNEFLGKLVFWLGWPAASYYGFHQGYNLLLAMFASWIIMLVLSIVVTIVANELNSR